MIDRFPTNPALATIVFPGTPGRTPGSLPGPTPDRKFRSIRPRPGRDIRPKRADGMARKMPNAMTVERERIRVCP